MLNSLEIEDLIIEAKGLAEQGAYEEAIECYVNAYNATENLDLLSKAILYSFKIYDFKNSQNWIQLANSICASSRADIHLYSGYIAETQCNDSKADEHYDVTLSLIKNDTDSAIQIMYLCVDLEIYRILFNVIEILLNAGIQLQGDVVTFLGDTFLMNGNIGEALKCYKVAKEYDVEKKYEFNILHPCSQTTVLFVNSIGAFGDSVPMPRIIEHYKKQNPQHKTVLYDTLYFNHFYEKPDSIDEIVCGDQVLFNRRRFYCTDQITYNAKKLYPKKFTPLRNVSFSHVFSTHHEHAYGLNYPERTILADYHSICAEILLDKSQRPYSPVMKPEYLVTVLRFLEEFKAKKRPIISIQNRHFDPYKLLQLNGDDYKNAIIDLAQKLVTRCNAIVLFCGDQLHIEDHPFFQNGDWMDINSNKEFNFYQKLEILKRTDIFMGTPSGFTTIVDFMRDTKDFPTMVIYANKNAVEGSFLQILSDKVGFKHKMTSTQLIYINGTRADPQLAELMNDYAQTPEVILTHVERLLTKRL